MTFRENLLLLYFLVKQTKSNGIFEHFHNPLAPEGWGGGAVGWGWMGRAAWWGEAGRDGVEARGAGADLTLRRAVA